MADKICHNCGRSGWLTLQRNGILKRWVCASCLRVIGERGY